MKRDIVIYAGQRASTHAEAMVFVGTDILEIGPSRRLRDHSLEFEWGFEGSGPAQLALAILFDFLGGDDRAAECALHFYQFFKFTVIAELPRDGWKLDGARIRSVLLQLHEVRPYTGDVRFGSPAGESEALT